MRRAPGHPVWSALFVLLALIPLSCVSGPATRPGTSLKPVSGALSEAQSSALRIEALLANGSPSAIQEAQALAQSSTALAKDEAASYAWVAYELARLVYPELVGTSSSAGTPPDSLLVKAFIDARNGRLSGAVHAGPLYEMLPVLGVFRLKTPAVNSAALSAAERFSAYGITSALVQLAVGMALERSGDRAGPLAAFGQSMASASDCYPAALAKAKLLGDTGMAAEALTILSALPALVKETAAYRRAYAMALYSAGRWTEAMPLITAVLMDDPLDSRFMLIRAHLLMENKEYRQASPLLDAYAGVDPNDRLYLLLRARLSMEHNKDRGAALSALRRALERYPKDVDTLVYAAELLWAGNASERSEAVVFAGTALSLKPANERALKVLLSADLASGDAKAAAARADAILAASPAFQDYSLLLRAYRQAGRLDDAAKMARSWLARDPVSEEANLAWLSLLIDRSEKSAASELVTRLLSGKGSSSYRSALYFQQSRLQTNDDAALASLRSALVENGMNLDALVATYDLYFKKGDLQRARFYLKQALTVAPDRPDLAMRRDALAQLGVAIP